MPRIAFIAPDKHLYCKGKAIVEELGLQDKVDFYLARLKRAIKLASRLQHEDVDVIVCRGGTASLIIESNVKIPVVEIAITGQDLAQVLHEAKIATGLPSPRITALGFSNTIRDIEIFAEILGVRLTLQLLVKIEDIPLKIDNISPADTDIVVGGVKTVLQARKRGLKAQQIRSGDYAFRTAFLEAQKIAWGRKIEKEQAQEFKALVNYSLEGIISVNRDKIITVFNLAAERILNTSASAMIGKMINQVLPFANVDACLVDGKESIGQILQVGNIWITINIGPIRVDRAITGAIITFQDITHIQALEARIRNEVLVKKFIAKYRLEDVLGTSDEMSEIKRIAQEIAPIDSTVLIAGESGTGKELFAQSIHNLSKRKNGPFVAVNCAALPPNLLESELFGYVEGAFTGATKKGKPGLFEMAHRGTIFLDEIAEMDKYGQSHLLRVLQEKQVMRLGDDKYIPIDVRIIAATNKKLSDLINEGLFRQDLFYRLKVLTMNLPPLRKRAGDVEYLAHHFLEYYKKLHNKQAEFTPKAYEALGAYHWPGNVRELVFFIERLVVTVKDNLISENVILKFLDDREYEPSALPSPVYSPVLTKEKIAAALALSNSNVKQAAEALGVNRSTLYRKLKAYKMEVKKSY